MHLVPAAFAFVIALALAPVVLAMLRQADLVRPNYRDVRLPVGVGVLIVASGFIALAPVALLARLADADIVPDNFGLVAVFVPGVALLGLVDDVMSDASRGLRGHGEGLLRGDVSTGALKAFGTLGLALLVASELAGSDGEYLLAAAVLVLSTHVMNLLDLRPGRAIKSLVVLGAALTITTTLTEPAATLGIFAAPALVAGFLDLRERAMLGDTGSGALGAIAGMWIVLTLDTGGQIAAAIVLAAITVIGELTSISALIEKVPGLRHLDLLGRPS